MPMKGVMETVSGGWRNPARHFKKSYFNKVMAVQTKKWMYDCVSAMMMMRYGTTRVDVCTYLAV